MKLFILSAVCIPILLLSSCSQDPAMPPFERTAGAVAYLKEVQQLDAAHKKTLFFIISGGCRTCTQQTIRFVHELDQDPHYNAWQKVLVTGGPGADTLLPKFTVKNFVARKDTNFLLERYGLMWVEDMIIEFSDSGTVSYYSQLNDNKINNAISRYYNN